MNRFQKLHDTFQKPKLNIVLASERISKGSGGSNNIIFIQPDFVLKLIPDHQVEFNQKYKNGNDVEEIQFYRQLTHKLLLKNKTPHIVGYFDSITVNIKHYLEKANCAKNINEYFNLRLEQSKEKAKEKEAKERKIQDRKKLRYGSREGQSRQSKTIRRRSKSYNKSSKTLKKSSKSPTQIQNKTQNQSGGAISKPIISDMQLSSVPVSKVNRSIRRYKLPIPLLEASSRFPRSQRTKSLEWNYPKDKHPLCRYADFRQCFEGRRNIYHGVYLENCYTTISKEFDHNLMKMSSGDIHNFIERVAFQYCFTMMAIYSIFPNFTHNDMFLRNILAINNTRYQPRQYIEYIATLGKRNRRFYFPANGIIIKLNDFGLSIANRQLGDKQFRKEAEFMNGKCGDISSLSVSVQRKDNHDTFNFFHDLYDGEMLGAKSLLNIAENNNKIKEIHRDKIINAVRTACKKFIDIKVIDEANQYVHETLDDIWNYKNISFLKNSVKTPYQYLNSNIFQNYTRLPQNAEIIATFEF